MKRKAVGLIAAAALFVVGTLVLVGYVRNAEQRAVGAEEQVDVLVVSQPIESGAAPVVRTERFPARLVGDDTVLAADSLDGLVAVSDLVPGEALLWSRLGEPAEAEQVQVDQVTRIAVPDGMAAVTIPVGTDRALGGNLEPGVRVAVVGSFAIEIDPDDPVDPEAESRTVQTTHVLVEQALVVEVQAEEPTGPANPIEAGLAAVAPTTNFLITVAAPIYDIERIVFANEWGSVWLAQQGATGVGPTQVQTADTIFDQFDGNVSISRDGSIPETLPFVEPETPNETESENEE